MPSRRAIVRRDRQRYTATASSHEPTRAFRRAVVAALAGAVFVLGCSGSPPEILHYDARLSLLRDPATGDIAEVLRLFVAVRDPDGADDPLRIFVIHDGLAVSWEMDRSEWVRVEHAGEQWYGMPDLRMPDGAAMPRGRYRLIVEDAALTRDESEFSITAAIPDRTLPFPSLRIDGREMVIDYRSNVILRVYNRSGRMLLNQSLPPGEVPDEVARQIPDESGLLAYLTSVEGEPRRESGPYTVAR